MAGDPGALGALISAIPILEAQPVRGAYAIIGGMALQLWYGLVEARTTYDVDLVVMIDRWDEYEELANQFIRLGWKRGDDEHRFVTPDDRLVDILPYPIQETPTGRVIFPRTRASLPTIGLAEAVLHAREIPLGAAGVHLRLATPEYLAALKAVAYYERQQSRDARDVTLLCRKFGTTDEVLQLLGAEGVTSEIDARGVLLAKAVRERIPNAEPMLASLARTLTDPHGSLVARLYREFGQTAEEQVFREEVAAVGRGLLAGLSSLFGA